MGLGQIGCDPERTTQSSPSSTGAAASAPEVPRLGESARAQPTRLLSLSSSAYHASIVADDDAAYLLTSRAVHRVVPGQAVEARTVELGFGATARRDGFVFWSDGALQEASKRDIGTRTLARLAKRPRTFVSSGDAVAWIDRSDDGRFSLASLSGDRASALYTSPGKIDAAAVLGDWIFFVERPMDGEWRIGGVRTSGGPPAFKASRRGRAPSMLVAHRELYYYDGNRREVRRLAPDLRREETLVTDFVCSPLAVAEGVYCANVEGIFALVPGARPRRLVPFDGREAVTSLAANRRDLYWVGDAGADKLVVHAVTLAAP